MDLYAGDFKAIAKETLKGHWLKAIIAYIIALIFGVFSTSAITGIGLAGAATALIRYVDEIPYYSPYMLGGVSAFILIQFFVGETIRLGYIKFNLSILDQTDVKISSLFSCFRSFWKALFLRIAYMVIVFLFSLLFLIPGLIVAMSYAMTPYVLEEIPEFTVIEALRASRRMMQGNKFRFFVLCLSFVLWDLLVILTLGLASFYVTPYKSAAEAVFYNEISGRADLYYGREPRDEDNNLS